MSSSADTTPAGAHDLAVRPERVFTWPLVTFLVCVAIVTGLCLQSRLRRPDLAEAIVLLADGDLDGPARKRMLRLVVDGSLQSQAVAHRWAGMLAAVVIDDRTAYATLRDGLGGSGGVGQVPAPDERPFLHLGDPMLAVLLQAMLAESSGDRAAAHRGWQQVSAQCRFVSRPFAATLAEAGLERTQ